MHNARATGGFLSPLREETIETDSAPDFPRHHRPRRRPGVAAIRGSPRKTASEVLHVVFDLRDAPNRHAETLRPKASTPQSLTTRSLWG